MSDVQLAPALPRPSRKGKERESSFAQDFQHRLVAIQRKNHQGVGPAAPPRSRDRLLPPIATDPVPPPPPAPAAVPTVVVSDASPADDFSRRLHISSSASPSSSPRARPAHHHNGHHNHKTLFNPNADPIPIRRTQEPDAMSESTGSSYAAVPARAPAAQRQLFDHKRDDPVRFAAVNAHAHAHSRPKPPVPTPRSSGDQYTSSASSYYAPSVASSSFTLSSSTTDGGSSDPSSIFDSARPEPKPSNVFTVQLKKLYRDITALEAKIIRDDAEDAAADDAATTPSSGSSNGGAAAGGTTNARVLLRSSPAAVAATAQPSDDAESARWQKAIHDHKTLAEMMHSLLGISTAPTVPTSLRNIPEKYNIVVRLWTYAFHRLLENLRRSALHSPVALEFLQSFIYFAYTFYTALYEEHNLAAFRAGWLEALGDLARYRMAVAAMLPQPTYGSSSSHLSASSASASSSGSLTPHPLMTPTSTMGNASDSSDRRPPARIDDSPSPSVGLVAARTFELEPEVERWRAAARAWYGAGVADTPGAGKLHHHLGLLAREAGRDDLRAVYHFTKSLLATHAFPTSRESVLPIWSQRAQARRVAGADSGTGTSDFADLFVLAHGMLFTHIELDGFASVQARLLERLDIDAPQTREWAMMACVNVGALLEYGKPTGVLRRAGALPPAPASNGPAGATTAAAAQANAKVKLARKDHDPESMDVDDAPSPALSEASASQSDPPPPAFTRALELAFAMLELACAHAHHRGRAPTAYATVLLTFLATVFRHSGARAALERAVPWDALARVLAAAPSRALRRADPGAEKLAKRALVPEDWLIRGTVWPGRTLFEKGYWKTAEDSAASAGSVSAGREMEVLEEREDPRMDVDAGKLEEDDSDGGAGGDASGENDVDARRWERVVWAGARLSRFVDGFTWEGGRAWSVRGVLAEKVAAWKEEERREREREREEEERRRRRWVEDEAMDVDEDAAASESESGDDEEDSPAVRELKSRRRYLRSLLRPSAQAPAPAQEQWNRQQRPSRPRRPAGPTVRLAPGYTVLVLDTNVLLASLPAVQALIESARWTVVVPLPVIMELDGLSSSNPNPNGINGHIDDGHGHGNTALADQARAAVELLVARVRTHPTSLKVQTSRGNYLSTLSIRREAVDFDDAPGSGGWERSMDDLILRAAVWQAEHWVDRSSVLGADGERAVGKEKDAGGAAAKVVLCSLDRNLRLKSRARGVDAAGERELAGLLVGAA